MTHEPRERTFLGAGPIQVRPLHEIVDRWRDRQLNPVVEWCVCGGSLRAQTDSDADVIAAVQQHQIDPVHIAYDEAHGIPLSAAQLQAKAIDGELVPEPIGGR